MVFTLDPKNHVIRGCGILNIFFLFLHENVSCEHWCDNERLCKNTAYNHELKLASSGILARDLVTQSGEQ